MDTTVLVDHGDVIGYALPGVLAIIGLIIIQLVRRRRDVRKARDAVRLVTYSIAEPRPGPVAVQGVWRESPYRRIDCGVHRVTITRNADIQRGTRGRWKDGVRSYTVREGDPVIAIGVMSKQTANDWSLAASPGEDGVQVYAVTPRPAPKPLWPWRAPLIFAICGGIAFGGLYGAGTALVDVGRDCGDTAVLRLEIGSALPIVRDDALTRLAGCRR
jgi:hypothetical protein